MQRCVLMKGVVTNAELVGRIIGLIILLGSLSWAFYEILYVFLK